jgi:CheY-like chemotaxis protein
MSAPRPKILLVEDNIHNHDLYRDVFTRAGFETVLRENADGFFVEEVADVIRPDIISMDLMMGKDGAATLYDGFEALAQLHTDERTKMIPVFILTSFFEEGKVRRAKELGAVDFISISGHAITKIPEYFLKYLEAPKKYIPVHPLMRVGGK